MIRIILVLAALLQMAHADPPEGYVLKWSDEFDGEKLDMEKWNHRTDSKLWSTQKPENVMISDGKLHLNLKKETAGGKEYTGAGVISKNTFKYGYYEARFRVPPGAGWHTSFWLMFHDGQGGTFGKNRNQEIDICEQDSIDPHTYFLNLHDWNEKHRDFGHKRIKTPDLSAGFHIWGCEFTPAHMRYYFEGKLVDERDATVLEHGDHHIWLTSIACHFGGTKEVDDSKLPSSAVFDYVRFYESEKAESTD